MWGDPGFQSSPLWVLLVLVLYTGLLSLALQFTAGAQSSLGLNKRPHRHEAGEYSLTPVFCPSAALLHMMVWHSRDSASESSPHRAYRPGPHSELRSATEFAH